MCRRSIMRSLPGKSVIDMIFFWNYNKCVIRRQQQESHSDINWFRRNSIARDMHGKSIHQICIGDVIEGSRCQLGRGVVYNRSDISKQCPTEIANAEARRLQTEGSHETLWRIHLTSAIAETFSKSIQKTYNNKMPPFARPFITLPFSAVYSLHLCLHFVSVLTFYNILLIFYCSFENFLICNLESLMFWCSLFVLLTFWFFG